MSSAIKAIKGAGSDSSDMVVRNISLPTELFESIAHKASVEHKSTNQVIREILESNAEPETVC